MAWPGERRGGARRQAGATLIELMIAMAIGLVMILALTRVYLASAESARDATAQASLMDKARLLQERFNTEFRRADFWGRVPADAERRGTLTLGGDCGGDFAFGRSAQAASDRPLGVWASTTPPSDCSLQHPLANQTFVVIRYAAEPCAAAGCGGPGLKSFDPFASFFSGTPPAEPARGDANDLWRYGGSLYYLSQNDGDTALRRLRLSGSRLSNQEVLEGVEALAYRWYVANVGGSGGSWQSSADLNAAMVSRIQAAQIEAVVSVATRATYQDSRQYTLSDGTQVAPARGRRYRELAFVVPLEMHRPGGGNG
ncbi:prepilin-type N-terminal cleavage/methylation domain-containing protein [Salinicola endophyticus]|uniref:Prepilin-type N-terminal cleavage/methylation domain-containing protein n=1 Tax=Salinicola endophyticus TaxID=1949083 RepID=A0AB74UDT5_9GAMM